MKIGIDARLLYYRKGGIPEYTRQLIKALAPLDIINDYRIVHNFRDQKRYVPATNFQRVNAFTPAHHRFERTALSFEMTPHRLNLFHSPDFIAPRHAAKRHVITIHDLHFITFPQFLSGEGLAYYQNNIRASVQRADHIFVQTETTKQEVVDLLNVSADQITVHWLGVDEDYSPVPQKVIREKLAQYNLPSEYILFVGTIEPRKNIPGLLEAYALLRNQYADMPHLVLGGQPGWHVEQTLAPLESLHLKEHVTWIRGVPGDVMPALYSGAQMLILPSHYEGFGMPAVEAMACGTPVIVTETGALPEVVGEAGLYVNPDEPDTIAAQIEQLLQDSTLRGQLSRDGIEHARRFTWEQTAKIVLKVYNRL
jgi:glycosyltransferase involved in cell wall biosynthesis